jgi:hypothetical protein
VRSVTAGGRKYLKSLPLGKLRQYAASYGIATNRAVEKDDIIDAVVAARVSHFIRLISRCLMFTVRGPMDACLLPMR